MNLKKNIIRILILVVLTLISLFLTKYISSDFFNYNFL
jgi:uncharacterized protein YxeA